MTSTVRQRKAFAFSDDGDRTGEENRILDDQGVIHNLSAMYLYLTDFVQ
jgi:hypothetical protein